MAPEKTEELIKKVGGRYMLVALLQKRVRELKKGARALVKTEKGMSLKEIALKEIWEDKVSLRPFEPRKEEYFDIEEDLFDLPE